MKKAVLPIAAFTAAISTMSVSAQSEFIGEWPANPVFIGSISASASKLNVDTGEVSGPVSIAGTFHWQDTANQVDSESTTSPQPPGTTSRNSKVSTYGYKVSNKSILDAMGLGNGWSLSWVGPADAPLEEGAIFATNKEGGMVAVPEELLFIAASEGVEGGSESETTAYEDSELTKYSRSAKGYMPVQVTVGTYAFLTDETADGVAAISRSTKLDKKYGGIVTTVSLKGPIDGPAIASGTF